MDMQMPIIHLFILLKKDVNLLIFSSLVKFAAIEKATMVMLMGKITFVIMDTMDCEKKATAGLHTATVKPLPLAAMSVNKIG